MSEDSTADDIDYGTELMRFYEAMQKAVAAERAACAQLADAMAAECQRHIEDYWRTPPSAVGTCENIAAAIRARGSK